MVVSCRVRLARNLEGFPFVPRLAPEQATQVGETLRAVLMDQQIDGETIWVSIERASPVLRLLLRERYLVSRDLAPTGEGERALPGRAVAFGESETVSVMINEEDHLRLQSLAGGFDLDKAWARVHALDQALEARVRLAHSRRLGYLTSCPTNVGTGLRASVMLHLPALGLVRAELEKVFAAAQRTGLAVRGMYGEGTRAAGDLYQISNQVTLGRSETQLVADLQALVPSVVGFERRVRQVLVEEQRAALIDRVSRAYGMLRTARALTTDQALAHLSSVRLGTCLGLVPGPALAELNQVTVQIQRGHVQVVAGDADSAELLESSERDRVRAAFLRRQFAERN